MALTAGIRIGPYEIVGALGVGGMGEVYRARDTRLDRVVAIKALPQELGHDDARLARFEREAKLLASLNHPNIAAIYGLEDSGGLPYLVLEFVAGETLAARLDRGPLTPQEALAIGRQIASAVEAAHQRGVVHRDLKPGNVMLTASGGVKVLDFGIAKGDSVASSAATSTQPGTMTSEGTILGTAAYMSPEQVRGTAVDRRSDVWAFGCVLFECLAGRRPFSGQTASDLMAKVLERDPEWGHIPAGAPTRLRDLIRRCLRKDRSERPDDIGSLGRELAEMAEELKPHRTGHASAESVPSLAVLYFENLSSDPESDYFCAGITEDILTDLSKIKGMRVASRNAVGKYRGSSVDIPRVAAELGVTAVMEGSVRRAGERVRITAQLINAADGFHLWAERYDRTLADVFAVQEEIASSIAAALRVAMTPSESRELLRDRPSDVRAYDLYLKGREHYGRYNLDSLRVALDLFERATQIEPDYALAWAGVADCYGQMSQWGQDAKSGELLRLGVDAARHAIKLGPNLAETHKAQSLVLQFSGDKDGSMTALRKAASVNPRFTPAWINMGVQTFEECDVAQAERLMRRALEIDPQDAFAAMWMALLFYLTRRDEESLGMAAEVMRLSSESFYVTGAHMLLAGVHVRRGDLSSARRTLTEGRMAGSKPANLLILEAVIACREGRLDEAGRLLTIAESSQELASLPLAWAAEIAIARGEAMRALGFFLRPISAPLAEILARLTPELHPLLDHPPLAPRRSARVLVWPSEAPPVSPEIAALFADVRVELGQGAVSPT